MSLFPNVQEPKSAIGQQGSWNIGRNRNARYDKARCARSYSIMECGSPIIRGVVCWHRWDRIQWTKFDGILQHDCGSFPVIVDSESQRVRVIEDKWASAGNKALSTSRPCLRRLQVAHHKVNVKKAINAVATAVTASRLSYKKEKRHSVLTRAATTYWPA